MHVISPYSSVQMMVSVCSEGGLSAPAAFFARILNSYLHPSCNSFTVKAVSTTFTLLAFTQILEGRSRLSTIYPVSLWPPSNCGSFHCRVTVLRVMLMTSGRPGASDNAQHRCHYLSQDIKVH